ncbi:MAG: hypothetical protein CMG00_08970 [Candidatus Marinimicrobia bacterium]|nr:hypothetical protein [Candidatus Neomarinimicrobiota bacterium]|tara:strand:- start:2187 stop:2816 length:630 start_codon:yes stop_codon:yes gene_type:complete
MKFFRKFIYQYLDIYVNSSKAQFSRSFRISYPRIFFIILFIFGSFLFLVVQFIFLNFDYSIADIDNYINEKRLESETRMIELSSPIKQSKQYFISKSITGNHNGVDISVKLKTEIFSSADGKVIYIGDDKVFGKNIILSHKNNFYTFYGHLDTIFVKSHQFVKDKELIGLAGETGNASGPHLHFEIWDDLGVLDPNVIITEFKERDVTQ